MPVYECSEQQFVENLRKLIDTNFKVIVKRAVKLYDDAKHSLSRIPDCEFEKYGCVMSRKTPHANVYAVKPFYDEFHRRFYDEDDQVHSSRYSRAVALSIPYLKVEYSFDIWGETYCYSLDALFQPEVTLEKRRIAPRGFGGNGRGRPVLIHVLSFKPPHPATLNLDLPPSVTLFDVTQKIKP